MEEETQAALARLGREHQEEMRAIEADAMAKLQEDARALKTKLEAQRQREPEELRAVWEKKSADVRAKIEARQREGGRGEVFGRGDREEAAGDRQTRRGLGGREGTAERGMERAEIERKAEEAKRLKGQESARSLEQRKAELAAEERKKQQTIEDLQAAISAPRICRGRKPVLTAELSRLQAESEQQKKTHLELLAQQQRSYDEKMAALRDKFDRERDQISAETREIEPTKRQAIAELEAETKEMGGKV